MFNPEHPLMLLTSFEGSKVSGTGLTLKEIPVILPHLIQGGYWHTGRHAFESRQVHVVLPSFVLPITIAGYTIR